MQGLFGTCWSQAFVRVCRVITKEYLPEKPKKHRRSRPAYSPVPFPARILSGFAPDHFPGASDQFARDSRDDRVRYSHARIGRLAEHVALVVYVIDQHEFAGFELGDLAGKKLHLCECGDS